MNNVWVSSTPYLASSAQKYQVTNAIDNTDDDPIYQTENWKDGDLLFEIKEILPGPYEVTLHFAEIYWNVANARVFRVTVEGQEVASNLDIYQAAGGRYKAYNISKEVYVSDGILNIELGKIIENPSIAGIEVHFLRDPKTLTGAPSTAPSMSHQPSLSEQPSTSPSISPAPTMVPPEPVWSRPYTLPLIAVAAANLPNGEIVFWSAYKKTNYGGSGMTWTAIFDPSTGLSSEALVQNTNHDMFCPGTSVLEDGRVMITGGSNGLKVTIYDPSNNSWTNGPDMNIARGYHAQTVLSDGSVFVLGGSWSGTRGGKNGEVFSDHGGWQLKSGITIPNSSSLLTADKQGVYRADNHMWLFEAPNGKIFHAGPSRRMHWIDLSGNGLITPSVLRGDDDDSMCGNAVMYDIGKILTIGGAPDYNLANGHNRAYVIDINEPGPTVERTGDMEFPRTMANSVVLPSGEVVVVGGQEYAEIFTDFDAVYKAEIWNPTTGIWRTLETEMEIPRTYHSVAMLMRDGRVWAAGGGLCGTCSTNHLDAEILTPSYLIDGDTGRLKRRPAIQSVPASINPGETISVTMDTSDTHTFALVRLSAVTHNTNNDMRRIPLAVSDLGGSPNIFELDVPNSYSIVLPGTYWLFAMNSDGVPSIGETVYVGSPALLNSLNAADNLSPARFQDIPSFERLQNSIPDNVQKSIDPRPSSELLNSLNAAENLSPARFQEISSFERLQNSIPNNIQESIETPPASSVVEGISVKSKAMSGHCLGIKQASEDDNAQAIQWPCHGGRNQLFDFHPQDDGGYRIVAEHSSKCLTVDPSGESPTLGDPVVQRSCETPAVDQIWTVEGNGEKQQIKEKETGLCLLRPGTSLNPGTNLEIGLCGDGFNSLWSVSDTSLVTASIVPGLGGMSPIAQAPIKSIEFSGLCVAIADGSMDAGAPAVQDLCREDGSELFSFQRVFEKVYRVVASHSSMCLTVENDNGVSAEGAIISQNPCTDDAHQLWRITGKGGNQRLIPDHGLHSTDVPYCLNNIGDDTAGNQMIQWPCTNVGAREIWSVSDVLTEK